MTDRPKVVIAEVEGKRYIRIKSKVANEDCDDCVAVGNFPLCSKLPVCYIEQWGKSRAYIFKELKWPK